MALKIYEDTFNGYKEIVEENTVAGGTVTYHGQAEKGSATSEAAWRIKRITVATVGAATTTTIEYALDSAQFSVKYKWDDRATLIYA